MPDTYEPSTDAPLRLDRPEDVRAVREVFEQANFNERAIIEHVGKSSVSALSICEGPHLEWLTRHGQPLDTLIRLFVGNLAVPIPAARAAVKPTELSMWLELGLLKQVDGEMVRRGVQITPYDGFYVASDNSVAGNSDVNKDYVMGIATSTLMLGLFTVRNHSTHTLDLGCGGGYQAFRAARHSDQVIASDFVPRACNLARFNVQLNGIENVEVRQGDMFASVEGERFDLIVANPPFVISPSSKFSFRDNPRGGEGICREVAREAGRFLNEGGHCQFLASWIHPRGRDWKARLAEWFEDNGCDVWVLAEHNEPAAVHASNWLWPQFGRQPEIFAREYEQWIRFYEEQEIESISFGLITMRKRASTTGHMLRIDEAPKRKIGPCGSDFVRGFALFDYLNELSSERDLLSAKLRVSPHVRLIQECIAEDEGWQVVHAQLRKAKGMGYTAAIDMTTAAMLAHCNGTLTLGEVIEALGGMLGVASDELEPVILRSAAEMISRSFLWPAEMAEEEANTQAVGATVGDAAPSEAAGVGEEE